jgi:hypothetical protein
VCVEADGCARALYEQQSNEAAGVSGVCCVGAFCLCLRCCCFFCLCRRETAPLPSKQNAAGLPVCAARAGEGSTEMGRSDHTLTAVASVPFVRPLFPPVATAASSAASLCDPRSRSILRSDYKWQLVAPFRHRMCDSPSSPVAMDGGRTVLAQRDAS